MFSDLKQYVLQELYYIHLSIVTNSRVHFVLGFEKVAILSYFETG